MDGLWSALKRWFSALFVEPTTVPEWAAENQEHCRIYRGNFVISDSNGRLVRGFSGRIVEWPGLPTDVYLRDPPVELRRHVKGPCLQLVSQEGPWFKLHWEKPARNFDESRAYVERLLGESFREKKK